MIALAFEDGGMRVNLAQAPQAIGVQLQKWLTLVLAHLHAAVARNMGDGGLIGVRTGDLRRALMERVTVTPTGVIGELWPDPDKVAYGGIQEEGGTVVPTHGQALTIPLEAMRTGNGVARGTAAQVRQDPQAFGFTGTFIPKGHSVIMGKEADGSVVPLFALKPSVTIPAHHYLSTTLVQEWAYVADLLESLTGEAVRVIFGEGAFPS